MGLIDILIYSFYYESAGLMLFYFFIFALFIGSFVTGYTSDSNFKSGVINGAIIGFFISYLSILILYSFSDLFLVRLYGFFDGLFILLPLTVSGATIGVWTKKRIKID